MKLPILPALAAVLALQAAPAQAAEPSHTRALAAGYKAAFLCSGIFTAGQTEAQVAADDLEGIYPEYQPLVRTLPAQVDRKARTVSVAFDDKLPPRIAAWRPGLGCTQLPIGAGPELIARLPTLPVHPPAGAPDARTWPDGDRDALKTPSPKVAAALDKVLDQAFDHATYGVGSETTAALVILDGRIVAERYRTGYDFHTPQRTWSAAKSITGSLVGRAVRLGLLKVDAPAPIPEWRTPGDPRAAITLADLTHMGSGLWTNGPGNRTDEIYLGGAAVTQTATFMPLEAAPGTRFRYSNDDALLAARSVRAALGDDNRKALAFPFTELFWKIGMAHTTPETDWQGNYILSSQVWTTARDLGRLGLLYLHDGVWNGERLLPEGWAKYVATPAPAQPDTTNGGPGYGALFWLYGPRQGLPEGTYGMNGNRGQYAIIVPTRHAVIVRRGFDGKDGSRFSEAKFAHDVLAALD